MSDGGVITWGVIVKILLIPIIVGIVIYFINLVVKRAFSRFFLGWEKYENEKEKNVEQKEVALAEWRRTLATKFDEVKHSVDEMKLKMPILVTTEECKESHGEMYSVLDKHGNRITALETKVERLEKN